MKQLLESSLLNIWYPAEHKIPLAAQLLRPLSCITKYVAARNIQHKQSGYTTSGSPVIVVVGNITTGGTGKTPLLIELARSLRRSDHSIAVVARGYGGRCSHRNNPHEVQVTDSSDLVGDESLFIATTLSQAKSSVPVVIGRDRAAAVDYLRDKYAPDVVLSDDGLQHYAMPRDIEFAVIDGVRGFGNELLLPAGPLREPISRLQSVDCTVVNGSPSERTQATINRSSTRVCSVNMQASGIRPLQDTAKANVERLPHDIFKQFNSLTLIAGIGNPHRFFHDATKMIADSGIDLTTIEINQIAFPDHYAYTARDIERLLKNVTSTERTALITTEKDAVKLKVHSALLTVPVYVVGQQVSGIEPLLAPILEQISAKRGEQAKPV